MANNSTNVKEYFLKTNRLLTVSLVAVLILVSAIFWYTQSVTLENSSFSIGAAFMLLAVVFYQLPYLSYLLTRRHFCDIDRAGIEILDAGWKNFRKWLESQ